MSDWNKNNNQPSDEDDDDDLNLDWLNDEFKQQGQPGKPRGESTGLTGELPWLQGDSSDSEAAPDEDADDLLSEWQSTKKGIQPQQRGEGTGLTGALDWQKAAADPGKAGRSDEDELMPWQESDEPAAASDTDEPAAYEEDAATPGAMPDWLSGMDDDADEVADDGDVYAEEDYAEEPVETTGAGSLLGWMSKTDRDALPEDDFSPDEFMPEEFAIEDSGAPVADIPDWLQDLEMPGETADESEFVADDGGLGADWLAELPQAETELDIATPARPDWLPQDFDESASGGAFEAGEYDAESEYAEDGYTDETQYTEGEYAEDAYADETEYAADEYAADAEYGEYAVEDENALPADTWTQDPGEDLFGEDNLFGEPGSELEAAPIEQNDFANFAEFAADDPGEDLFGEDDLFGEPGSELEAASVEQNDFANFAEFAADDTGEDLFGEDDLFGEATDFAEPGAELEPQAVEQNDFADLGDFAADDEADFELDDIFGEDAAGTELPEIEPAADASWLNEVMESDDFQPAAPALETADESDFAAALDAVGDEDDEFGWLDDMDPTAEDARELPAAVPGVADWLDGLEPAEAGADAEPVLEADDEDFASLFDDDEAPAVDTAYLRSMVGGEKDAVDEWFSEDDEIEEGEPDWLSSVEEQPEEEPAPLPAPRQVKPAPPPPQEEEFDLDRLLDDMDVPASRPGMTAELTSTDLDRLFGGDESPISSPARNTMPDFEAILDQAQSAPVDPSELPEDKFDVPDWLREAASSGAEAAGTSAAALIRRQKDRPLNDLDDRLQALRDSGLSLAGEQDVQENAESSRRLAAVLPGIKQGLARGDLRPGESAPSSVLQTLEITTEQEQRAALLMSLLGAGAAGKALDAQGKIQTEAKPQVERQSRRSIFKIFAGTERAVITLLLALAVFTPFFASLDTGTNLPLAFAAGSAGDTAYQQITALPANALVLVAAEYGPAGAAELDDLTRILLTHIRQRGARPVIVSTNPVGLLHADNLVSDLIGETARNQDYYSIAYLPGSAIGLRNLVAAPLRLFSADVRGNETGLQVNSLADFALVVIITDNADALRSWMEQVAPSVSAPMIVASGYAAVPLVQPYVQRAAGTTPLLVGFQDAYTYTAMLTGGAITPPPVPTLPPTIEPTQIPVVTAEIVATEILPTDIPATTAVLETPTDAPTSTPEPPTATLTASPTASDTPSPTFTPSPTNTEPPTATFTSTPLPVVDVATITSDSTVNLRSGSGTNFDIVGELSPGDKVLIKGYNNDRRQWVNVVLPDGTEGWVAGFLVRIDQVPGTEFEARVTPPRRNAAPSLLNSPRRNSNPRQGVEQGGEGTAQPEATAVIRPTGIPFVTPTPTPEPTRAFVPLQATAIPNGDARRDAMTLGTLAAVVLITLGNIYYIVRWLLTREA